MTDIVLSFSRLFKNVFKIKGTPDGAMKSRYKSRRSISMASKTKRISSPELSYLSNTNKENTSALCSPLSIMTSPLKVRAFVNFLLFLYF